MKKPESIFNKVFFLQRNSNRICKENSITKGQIHHDNQKFKKGRSTVFHAVNVTKTQSSNKTKMAKKKARGLR